jgi:hypothetical protein
VWRVNDKDKALLSSSDQSKFYTGDCYIFQYTYPGDDKEECLIGTWFGKKSVEEDRITAVSLASKMVESAKFQAVQVTQRFSLYGIFKLDKNPCVISTLVSSLMYLCFSFRRACMRGKNRSNSL